jgi:hypothetical protein
MKVLSAIRMAALMATAGLFLGASAPVAAITIALDSGCTAGTPTVDGTSTVINIPVSCGTTTPSTPVALSGCALSVSPSAPTAGQTFTITGRCTGGTAPITFVLSGPNVPSGLSSYSGTAGSAGTTYSYTATASNAAGPATSVTGVSFTVGSGSTIAAACTAAGYPDAKVIQMDWNNPREFPTKDIGGFGPNDVLVVAFTVPASTTPTPANGGKSSLYGSEVVDLPVSRTGYLSKSPCDFSMSYGKNTWTESIAPRQYFTVGTTRIYSNTPAVVPGATVYWNIKNTYPGQCLGTCNFFAGLYPSTM